MEIRLGLLLSGVVAVTLGLLLFTWLSGGLGFVVREIPLWLTFGIVLTILSVGAAAYGLLSPVLVHGNLDDLIVVREIYQGRIRELWIATVTSAALFMAALLLVLIPAMVAAAETPQLLAPRIAFDTSDDVTIAHVSFSSTDVARGDHLVVEARTFASGTDARGVTIGRATASGGPSGVTRVDEALAVNRDARFLSVRVWFEGQRVPRCSPRRADGPGCALATVPQRGTAVPAVALGTTVQQQATSVVTPPSVSISPSPSPSASITPPSTGTPTP